MNEFTYRELACKVPCRHYRIGLYKGESLIMIYDGYINPGGSPDIMKLYPHMKNSGTVSGDYNTGKHSVSIFKIKNETR